MNRKAFYFGAFRVLLLTTLSLFFYTHEANADLLCIKKQLKTARGKTAHSKALRLASSECPHGYRAVLDTAVFKGADGAPGKDGTNGTNGKDGADATTLLYGTGASGNLVVSSGIITLEETNFQNITIEAGATLSVRSGTVIRCTGTLNNAGTISVNTMAGAGLQKLPTANTITQKSKNPVASGISGQVAGNGECGTDTNTVSGGYGGEMGFNTASALHPRLARLGFIGGGGGGSSSFYEGGNGGGVVFIVCERAVSNSGTIIAKGGNGSGPGGGGGGGGVIVVASATSIENSGTISTIGGNGATSDSKRGAGGGGSGGAIILISPQTSAGTADVSGGTAGDNSTSVTETPRCAGGGGGPSLSYGGSGGGVTTNGATTASAGQSGAISTLETDPVLWLLNL